jgi:predicted dehydrogenase
VLCEKPMALNLEDAGEMIAAARTAGRTLMIAQCIRFWPEYQFLKQTVQNETLGKLLALNLVRMGGLPIGWSWENWFLDPARSGGTLYDLHIHDVDFVNSVFGAPQRLAAFGRRASPESACEVIQTVFSYAHGPFISIQAGWSEVQVPFNASYEAWFENGFVRFDPGASPSLLVYDQADRQNAQPAVYTPGDAYFNELQYFINCIQHNQDVVECPPESARDSLALLARIRQAILQEEQT